MANSRNTAKALISHGVMKLKACGGGFRDESRIYNIDMLLVCRRISVIYDVCGIRICVGVAVPATSTFGIKKRIKVHVVVDSTLESVIY